MAQSGREYPRHCNRGHRDGYRHGERRLTPAPAPKPLWLASASCLDWFVAKEAVQFVGEFLCRGVPFRRFVLQTLETNGLQIPIHFCIEDRWMSWLLLEHLPDRLH